MAKRLIWSVKARKEFVEILQFWTEHNKSSSYSKKLRKKIRETLQIVTENNYIGKPTTDELIRVTICDNYVILYEILPEEILVVRIVDGRRNPHDIKFRHQED